MDRPDTDIDSTQEVMCPGGVSPIEKDKVSKTKVALEELMLEKTTMLGAIRVELQAL